MRLCRAASQRNKNCGIAELQDAEPMWCAVLMWRQLCGMEVALVLSIPRA
jgi:hypothetical protein